ncbi:hypothetical protein PHLGIDRAFT_110983 [Phlebiopsis gigantea 11061_1 CR5-6]|uniref:NAD-dependent epimerase/dehydratase domain-containing protein n=1 Tax=Phlebiopsis gigantea (strain 11061_1 CR5-6) TaxID=745531 RepID=A0A0C3NFC1_PHLG1|nr:hypothetical protein PHLGIDRAFT_110983 [Phlebiopsis gigantea 11061_1 CR5-6]
MPAITQGKGKVLVSGTNGYIAMWVVKSLLEKGYSVRGTVRSESKIAHLKDTFKSYGDKLDVVVVSDITKDCAFHEAVVGVEAIAHTASPFYTTAKEPDELLDPAVRGTLSILQSALAHGDTVKRVVITSSTAAIASPSPTPRVFTEADWNEYSPRVVAEQGAAAPPADMYRASKALAERAAWDFVAKHKERIGWDLAVINPPFVYGPVLHEVSDPEQLNTSMVDWYRNLVKSSKTNEQLLSITACWVDVRDVGLAHALALEKPAAGGERIIVAGSPYIWQEWVTAAHKFDPSLPAGNVPFDPATAKYHSRYDSTKSQQVLGLRYHTIEECTVDTLTQFKEKGWY